MKETEDIIAAFKKAQKDNKKTALATVVHVQGSSYRRPGARMLITEEGELTGAISGGCLEGDALRKALLAINQQQNKLVTYDSMYEDDNSIGIQLGCNGIVHILFEPIDSTKANNPLALLEKTSGQINDCILVTLFNLDASKKQYGTQLLVTKDVQYEQTGMEEIRDEIEKDIAAVFEKKQSVIKEYQYENISALIELVKPTVEIVIAGAGNDAFPLVQMATILGWHITIIDGRNTHANTKRFPSAKRIIVAKPADALQQIRINEQTVFVLMSHNYNYDLAMLKALAHTNCGYIGVLGPRKKLGKMLGELQQQGIILSNTEKIYGPTGLDIGAETAEEIALSIIAEIKAILSNKNAATLRDKTGFIHEHYPAFSTPVI